MNTTPVQERTPTDKSACRSPECVHEIGRDFSTVQTAKRLLSGSSRAEDSFEQKRRLVFERPFLALQFLNSSTLKAASESGCSSRRWHFQRKRFFEQSSTPLTPSLCSKGSCLRVSTCEHRVRPQALKTKTPALSSRCLCGERVCGMHFTDCWCNLSLSLFLASSQTSVS